VDADTPATTAAADAIAATLAANDALAATVCDSVDADAADDGVAAVAGNGVAATCMRECVCVRRARGRARGGGALACCGLLWLPPPSPAKLPTTATLMDESTAVSSKSRLLCRARGHLLCRRCRGEMEQTCLSQGRIQRFRPKPTGQVSPIRGAGMRALGALCEARKTGAAGPTATG
jgi:hypothetical protein